jgi:hypothetical protein
MFVFLTAAAATLATRCSLALHQRDLELWQVEVDIRRANETAAVLRGYMEDPKIAQTIFSNGYQDGFLVCSELLSKPAERTPGVYPEADATATPTAPEPDRAGDDHDLAGDVLGELSPGLPKAAQEAAVRTLMLQLDEAARAGGELEPPPPPPPRAQLHRAFLGSALQPHADPAHPRRPAQKPDGDGVPAELASSFAADNERAAAHRNSTAEPAHPNATARPWHPNATAGPARLNATEAPHPPPPHPPPALAPSPPPAPRAPPPPPHPPRKPAAYRRWQGGSLDNCTDALAARVAATGAKAAELHGTYRPRITALRAELEDYVRRKYADAYEKGYSVCPGVWVIDSSHQLPTRLKARRRARE